MKGKLAWSLLALIGGYQVIRRLGQRSGATDEEVDGALPGDDVIPHPMIETTHAITISATAVRRVALACASGLSGFGRRGLVYRLAGRPAGRCLLSPDHAPRSPTVRSRTVDA